MELSTGFVFHSKKKHNRKLFVIKSTRPFK